MVQEKYKIIANKWSKYYNLQKYLIDNRCWGVRTIKVWQQTQKNLQRKLSCWRIKQKLQSVPTVQLTWQDQLLGLVYA